MSLGMWVHLSGLQFPHPFERIPESCTYLSQDGSEGELEPCTEQGLCGISEALPMTSPLLLTVSGSDVEPGVPPPLPSALFPSLHRPLTGLLLAGSHTLRPPVSEPLHLVFPLPGTPAPRSPVLSSPSGLCPCAPPQRVFLCLPPPNALLVL